MRASEESRRRGEEKMKERLERIGILQRSYYICCELWA